MSFENLSIRELVTFRTVVEAAGINAAARRLRLSRSVVSKRISDLETSLGVALFQRSTRTTMPTREGEAFYARAALLLQDLEEAANAVRQRNEGLSGLLRVTVPVDATSSFLCQPVFGFARKHPELSLTVDLDDRIVNLATEGYDVGIRIGRLRDSALRARRLCESPRALVASPEYLERRGPIEALDDLAHHEVIGYTNAAIGQIWRFAGESKEERAVRVVPRVSFNNGSAMRAAAVAGFGITVLPMFILSEDITDGRLATIDLPEKPLPDDVHAVYPGGAGAPTKVRAFIDHLRTELKRNVDQ